MEFLEMVLKLKSIYINEIVFVSCGAFYLAVAEDAVILNKKLNLKVNCMRRNMCKVGIPKKSIEKYVEKLNKLGYSYIVLDFNKENKTLTSIYSKEGDYKQCSIININCFECSKNKYDIKTDYEIALDRYLAEEVGE